jgi:hypothetical protein
MYKELNLTNADDVDLDAVDKYSDAAFDDTTSAQSYKAAARKCNDEISSNFKNILAKYEAIPFQLSKNNCNVKFMAMTACVEFETFRVRETNFLCA